MADNVAITAGSGTTIATDDIGGGVQIQRVKPAVGADGAAVDVSATAPMPMYLPDAVATGTITVTDAVVGAPAGAGALVTGASTAGSLVFLACPGGDSSWVIQVTGLTAGTLYFEGSLDSTTGTDGNWVALSAVQTGLNNTVNDYKTTSSGSVWRGNTAGLKYIRIRSVGALTGTPAIVIRTSDGGSAVSLVNSVPTGSNVIGSIKKAPSATGTISAPAISASSFTVLASNTARLGATVYNDSTVVVYVGLATTTSTTSYTVQLPPGGYFELPNDGVGYTGIITGIAATATGNLRVTELTP